MPKTICNIDGRNLIFPNITRKQFKKRYEEGNGGIDLEDLDKFVIPCFCKFDDCKGWQVVTGSSLSELENKIYSWYYEGILPYNTDFEALICSIEQIDKPRGILTYA